MLATTMIALCSTLALSAHTAPAAPADTTPTLVVTNETENAVWEVGTANNTITAGPISVGKVPRAIAITPDGRFAYVSSTGSNSLSVVDLAHPSAPPAKIDVGASSEPIAITPDGKHVYVTDGKGLSVIDTATNTVVPVPDGEAINVRGGTQAMAITPDGKRIYIATAEGTLVSVDTATNTEAEAKPVRFGHNLIAVAITPDGKAAYVVSAVGSVTVVDLATSKVVKTIPVGAGSVAIAITPNGKFAYVADEGSEAVSVIDTATNTVQTVPDGSAISVGKEPRGIAIAPDGMHAYVTNSGTNSVSVIDTTMQDTVGGPITFPALHPFALAITPLQGPQASFKASPERVAPGQPVKFDASASTDPDGIVVSYTWDFGDGTTETLKGPSATHAYAVPGAYPVALKLTDDHGCASERLFTGQTAYCNGSAAPPQTITVASPAGPTSPPVVGRPLPVPGALRVRIGCPKKARGGCRIALQVIAKRPRRGRKKVKAETAVARVRLRPGRSMLIPLTPKAAYEEKLAGAKKVLVRERLASGHKRRTLYRRLPILR